jgi:hypothetical protein
MEHLGRELVDHRKELIKFAWNHLKSDDSLAKQWAYVNVCRFIAVYETPPKIILQASGQLHQQDPHALFLAAPIPLVLTIKAVPSSLLASNVASYLALAVLVVLEGVRGPPASLPARGQGARQGMAHMLN